MLKVNRRLYDSKTIGFNIGAWIIITFGVLFCLFPIIIILSGSLTDETTLLLHGHNIWPEKFSTEAYQFVFKRMDSLLQAYKNTTVIMFAGTFLGLLCITMAGYVLSRRDFKYRYTIAFLIYFTSIFGGGLIPWYMVMTNILHLRNSYLARLLPGLMSPYLIFLMRTFIQRTVPVELIEAGKIDGANDFRLYRSVVLPILIPGMATIGLFLALGYWNEWYNTSIFITDKAKYSLQYYLYTMLNSAKMAREVAAIAGVTTADVPAESTKMAMVVVTTGPIIFLYPIVQRYFVTGLTIGSVKG